MNNITNTDSVPDYINKFIVSNEVSIKSIYINEKEERGDGFIYINVNVKDNKLDLMYLTFEEKENIHLDDNTLKEILINDKILIIIDDNEYKKRFIIYI